MMRTEKRWPQKAAKDAKREDNEKLNWRLEEMIATKGTKSKDNEMLNFL